MLVDPRTFLFVDISPEERMDLFEWCESVVLDGNVPSPDPPWVDGWLKLFNLGPNKKRRGFIVESTLPQMVLMSLLVDRKSISEPGTPEEVKDEGSSDDELEDNQEDSEESESDNPEDEDL